MLEKIFVEILENFEKMESLPTVSDEAHLLGLFLNGSKGAQSFLALYMGISEFTSQQLIIFRYGQCKNAYQISRENIDF